MLAWLTCREIDWFEQTTDQVATCSEQAKLKETIARDDQNAIIDGDHCEFYGHSNNAEPPEEADHNQGDICFLQEW